MKRVFTIPTRVHGGKKVIMSWQTQQGNFLAITGSTKLVTIYDRHGELKDEFVLPGVCTGLCWDKNGDILAVGNEKNGVLFLWNATTMKSTQLDTGFKDSVSYLIWSKVSQILAVGTSMGNLLLYNHQNSRKIPIIGKHVKKIIFGCWNAENMLALGSEDKVITISNSDGDTIKQTTTRLNAEIPQFSFMKTNERSSGETTLSLTIGHRSLLLLNLADLDNPIELAFQSRYGNIVKYRWFGDGYIMLGFSTGYLVVVSTHPKEIGQELFQTQDHKEELNDIAISLSLKKAASCGDNVVKIHELNDLKEIFAIITVEDAGGSLDKVEWTEDGQLLAVSTQKGAIHVYLTMLPILADTYNTRIAYLTSLREITVVDEINKESFSITTDVEPNFLAIGPCHLASGMNNRVWFYSINEEGCVLLNVKEYLGTVTKICLNSDYVAVGFDGKVQLQVINGKATENSTEKEGRLFPDDGDKSKITCFILTNDFFIYGNESGHLKHFYIEDWMNVNEYSHVVGIQKLYPDSSGTKLVFIDDKNDGFVYCPVVDSAHNIQQFPPGVKSVLWDNYYVDKGIFCGYDQEKIYLFGYSKDSVSGFECQLALTTKLLYGYTPVMLHNGKLTCQTNSGKLQYIELIQECPLPVSTSNSEMKSILKNLLVLRRFEDAWSVCEQLNEEESWKLLAEVAAKQLDIKLAIRVNRKLKNVAMVLSLEKIKDLEDKNLLGGYVAMILKDFNLAQELFLASSSPVAALEMRRSLLHWDQALELAKGLAIDQIPFISKEYAQQLEFIGDYSNALINYERGISNEIENKDHNELCQGGIARMTIRLGDIRRGVSIAIKSSNKVLKKECASLLENMKQFSDSAALFEKAECWERAAGVYIKMKQWNKVGELLKNINSPKLLLQYAKAKELDGKYKDAAAAYKKAKDYENVIRINLEHLQNPEEAVLIVRETQSVEGAKMVAKFFQKLGDFASAIQFLVMSRCNDEAFTLAQEHDKMEQYAEIIGDAATAEDYNNMAVYFENQRESLLAGKFFSKANFYQKALNHLLRCPVTESGESVILAIETIKNAKDEKLTLKLIDFLIGEVDGIPKDSRYLFQLYMALERYPEAAKTAVIIAQSDQEIGNYRNAHDVLFSMFKELRDRKIKIPSEMNQNLMLLHSYILCKIHIKRGDHMKGARMLIRVANNISKFPQHVVPILTSTVIECHRAGLKNHSFSFASMLMRAEYRSSIDLKYKKKIEMIVRKPDKTEEDEPLDPCPFCSYQLPQTRLDCPECKQNIPYCIITGRHMVKEDWCVCPNCSFPALCTEFKSLLSGDDTKCPMCAEHVMINSLKADPTLYLKDNYDPTW
ncbi:WD repeat-containing protein 19 isoform X1 [Hydra vulgaris]|uniref:WD repeat-containing protein 19 isoform X1 n=1 Tax=Hydra vulgaris TaxID=6087 RepID=UPI000640ECB7|nr:WD repeat-containing protein 19 [Hydra vulgaris]